MLEGLIKEGMIVTPTRGFWTGVKGKVIKIHDRVEYPIEVEFEENESNCYYEEQLEIVDTVQ